MSESNQAVGAPLVRNVRPVAEVCGPDICQDHAGPVEALSFLPTGTALYDQSGLDEAAEIERERLLSCLRRMHTEAGGMHNYYLFAVRQLERGPNVAGNRLAEGKSELTGLLGGPTRSKKE